MILKTLLRAALAGCVFPALSLLAQPEEGDPVAIGFTFIGWAMIDGIVDGAWDALPKYPIANAIQGGHVGSGDPDNPSSWWKSMYDEENLYLLVSVKDDVLVPFVNGSIEFADNVEVFLSGPYSRKFAPAWDDPSAFGDNDYHIRFGIGEAAGEGPQISAGRNSTPFWVPESGVVETDRVKYACVAVEGGYLMEIQISLELLYEYASHDFRDDRSVREFESYKSVDERNVHDYRRIGFEVRVTDNDSGTETPDQRLAWAGYRNIYPGDPASDGSDTAWAHTGTWGTLVFVERWAYILPDGYHNDWILHWVYHFGYGWALWYGNDFDSNWGYLYLGDPYRHGMGWKYHLDRGWLYFLDGSVRSEVFVYSPALGWLVASEAYGQGQFYRYDTESFEPWVP